MLVKGATANFTHILQDYCTGAITDWSIVFNGIFVELGVDPLHAILVKILKELKYEYVFHILWQWKAQAV